MKGRQQKPSLEPDTKISSLEVLEGWRLSLLPYRGFRGACFLGLCCLKAWPSSFTGRALATSRFERTLRGLWSKLPLTHSGSNILPSPETSRWTTKDTAKSRTVKPPVLSAHA